MDFKELVREARSVRRFVEADRISAEILTDLVDTARICPSGANLQPLRYALVNEENICAQLFEHLAWAGALKDWPGPAEGERPAAYIVMLSAAEKASPATDIGIAAQVIQLAAKEKGLGCCMLGAIKRDKIHSLLEMSADLQVDLVLALGKPAETVMLEDMADNDCKYWRDGNDVHHVPKRSLEEIIIRPVK